MKLVNQPIVVTSSEYLSSVSQLRARSAELVLMDTVIAVSRG